MDMESVNTALNVSNVILAVILLFVSVRGILTEYFDLSRSKNRFVRFFFVKSEEMTANKLLKTLGYNADETDLFRRNAYRYNFKDSLTNLIEILKNNIYLSQDSAIKFGTHESSYYIDTMGAAHDQYVCSQLNSILWRLIRKKNKNIDFVFSPKDGNINLITSFDKNNGSVFSIIAKSSEDKSSITGKDNDEICAKVNFEGLNVLMEKAKEAKTHQNELTGVAITCNLSNGSSMLESILRFNETLKKLNTIGVLAPAVKPITELFVLYRAIDDPKIDDMYEGSGITCYRFFDLNDSRKKELYDMRMNTKTPNESFSCYQCIVNKKINNKKVDCSVKHCWRKM